MALTARSVLLVLAIAASVACTGNDTEHWSCYDPPRSQQTGGAPHKFNDSGSHRCTKQELDAAGIDPSVRPADQR